MALAKRGVATAAASQEYVPFLSPDFYSGVGNAIPPGEYALEFEILLHQSKNQQTGQTFGAPRLSVMITAYPIGDDDPEANKKTQALSMGTKADQSFAPSSDGKRMVAKPGGSGGGLNDKTNWAFFLQSLFNSGLPKEVVASGDLSVLDGIWVHLDNVPEPEERKQFKSGAATGEAAAGLNESRGNFNIPVVSEILEGGMPWEGGGGMPDGSQAKSAPAVVVSGKANSTSKASSAKARAAEPPPSPNGDVRSDAVSFIGQVLGNVDIKVGISKNKLRNETYRVAGKGELADAILTEFFASDDALGAILSEHGFALDARGNVVSA